MIRRRAEVEASLRAVVEGENLFSPGFPDVAHSDLVKRALDRRQPFETKGKDGYRDALLWETVIELATEHEVILVSNDPKAFAGEKQDLSATLTQEAEERLGRSGGIVLCTAVDKVVQKFAEEDEGVERRISELLRFRSFRAVFQEQLEDSIEGRLLTRREASKIVPGVAVPMASTTELVQLGRVTVKRAYPVGDDLGLVEIAALASVGIGFFAPASDLTVFRSGDDVWPAQGDWEDLEPEFEPDVHLTAYRFADLRIDGSIRLEAGAIERLEVTGVRLIAESQFAPIENPVEEDQDA